MVTAVFTADVHQPAKPVPIRSHKRRVVAPDPGGASLLVLIDPGQVRTQAALLSLLDDLIACISADKVALHSIAP